MNRFLSFGHTVSYVVMCLSRFSLSTVQSGIFVLLGTIPDDNYFEVIATAIVEILAYLVYLILVDRVGRQPLFVWGLVIGKTFVDVTVS